MKATTFALILLSILTGTCLTSCIDDDFTTNPSHVLAFSTDTVAFDTVFTTIGTSTRSFRIYNRNKKSLNISSIKLADAELTQKKQPRDHDNVAHQRANGDAGNFFFGCCL